MKFHQDGASYYVPDGADLREALKRVTHLGIGAHQDDLEFMAYHGIQSAFGRSDAWFAGVVCTDGAGSVRAGCCAGLPDGRMRKIRREEQERAAEIGEYSAVLQLDYASRLLKDPTNASLKEELKEIITLSRPSVIYTHNPADKHDTHIAVCMAVILALRELPESVRPSVVYGCEVWRGLDWMPDGEKVVQELGRNETLARALHGVFESQNAGGKRYDLAVEGRWKANATFFDPHAVDGSVMCSYAMDLSPLIRDGGLDVASYVTGFIQRFADDVRARLDAYK